MMIGDEEEDEELRDLTQEDAEELKRFQEKRRWFERKLKVSCGKNCWGNLIDSADIGVAARRDSSYLSIYLASSHFFTYGS